MWKSIAALLLVTMLTSCTKPSSDGAGPRGDGPAQKVTLAFTLQPQSTLVHIAVAKGYFAEEGLEVQASMHTYGKAALQAVLDGKADFATVAETPVMFSVLKGSKINILANIEASAANNAVVARADAGITEPAALKGKRIGYTPGTTSDFFLDSLLTANGLTRKDIRAVALKPEEMQAAIMAKTVDAVSTWNYPLTLIKHQLGANGHIFYDRQIYTETFNIAAQQDYVHKNPDTVQRLLRALIRAERFVAEYPDQAQTIMASAINMDKRLIQEVWGAFNYHVALDQTLLITLEDEARWAIQNHLTDATVMPDFRQYIYFDGLKAVQPKVVGIEP